MKKKYVILDVIYFVAFVLVCIIVLLLIRAFRVERKELGVDFSKNVLLKQQDNCLLYKFDDDSSSDNNTFNSQKNIIKNDRDSDDSNEDGWIKLYDLDELRNETNNDTDSDSNVEKEFEFRVFENVIQWSFLGENNWNDLISVFDIISTQNDDNDETEETQLDIDETAVNNIVVAVNNNINNLGCYNNGTECEKGTLFTIKVNKDNVYNFYVIDDNGETISLIMDSNIVNDEFKTLPFAAENDNTPIYSLEFLNNITSDWNFIDYIDEYNYLDHDNSSFAIDNGLGKYIDNSGNEYVLNGYFRARFLSVDEAYDLGCRNIDLITRCNQTRCIRNNECPYWVYKNLGGELNSLYSFGYWLLGTDFIDEELGTYAMFKEGDYIFSSMHDSSRFGVRPVINIKRS